MCLPVIGFITCVFRIFCIRKEAKSNQSSSYDTSIMAQPKDYDGNAQLSKLRVVFMSISIAAAYMVWGLIISLLPPFYPREAELRGATPAQYGFVFGAANLAAFIAAPIFGRFGGKMGAKLLYNLGAYLQALCTISLGLLYYAQDVNVFIGLSYMLRALGGVADAAAWSAVLGILMALFPSRVARIISFTQMFFGIGYMMGPALGALLYEAGGFILPFVVVGGIGLVVATALLVFIPNVKSKESSGDKQVKVDKLDKLTKEEMEYQQLFLSELERPIAAPRLTYLDVVKSPSIVVPLMDNVLCWFGNGCILSMLEPHLAEIGADAGTVSITFLLFGLVFAVSTPITGIICERVAYVTTVSLAGNLFLAVVLTLIGPLPFINLEPSVPLVQGLMCLVGVGFALVMVSTFSRAQTAPIRLGYQRDLSTYLLMSGLWSGTLYLGGFLGPTIAGLMVDAYGFRTTTVLYWALYLLAVFVDVGDLAYNVKMGHNKNSLDYQKI